MMYTFKLNHVLNITIGFCTDLGTISQKNEVFFTNLFRKSSFFVELSVGYFQNNHIVEKSTLKSVCKKIFKCATKIVVEKNAKFRKSEISKQCKKQKNIEKPNPNTEN